MTEDTRKSDAFSLPDDLVEKVGELAERLGESRRFIVVAAVEHFFRIPEEQRRAVLRGTALRRK